MSKPVFINIDMELSSSEDLSPLANELDGKIYVLQNEFVGEDYKLSFECNLNEEEPSKVLIQYVKLISGLSENSKDLLKKCNSRILDFGYESGMESVLSNSIPAAILSDLVALNYDLVVTIYPVDEDEAEIS
jgi:hypothetical protein